MMVYRCDNCKKVMKNGESLRLGFGFIGRIELCQVCAVPILKLISDQKLLAPKLVKKIREGEPLIKELEKLQAKEKSSLKAA